VGRLLDNREPGTQINLILWASIILEGLGWVDESFVGEKSAWPVLPLLSQTGWREQGMGGCSAGQR